MTQCLLYTRAAPTPHGKKLIMAKEGQSIVEISALLTGMRSRLEDLRGYL